MEEKKADVIALLRSCLVSTKGFCSLRQLNSDFKTLMGYPIPHENLGYRSLEQFILTIPSLSTSRIDGALYIDAKVSDKSSHIAKLVNKQKDSKKRTVKAPIKRYTIPQANQRSNERWRPPQANVETSERWRPKQNTNNWKKTYQSSPRPAAVSHNQFIDIPTTSRLPSRLANRLSSPIKTAATQPANTTSSVNSQLSSSNGEPSLTAKARRRIDQKMADIKISKSKNVHVNGLSSNSLENEMEKLQEESLAAVDLKSAVWKWSSGDESSDSTNNSNAHSNPYPVQEPTVVFTGDSLADLFAFVLAHNLEEPNIKVTRRHSKSSKTKLYDCYIKVGKHSGSSYPDDCRDEMTAKQIASKRALDGLVAVNRQHSQSLLVSDPKDILERIPPLVQAHFSGIWNTQLEEDYAVIYNEQLPLNWLEIVDTLPCITVLPLLEKKYVLRFCKPGEKGSIFATPTVSQVSIPSNTVKFNDDGMLTAQITCIASAGEIWCRQVDTNDCEDFNKMIANLEQYYSKERDFVKTEAVDVGGYYVAYYEHSWCRVRVFEVQDSNVNCFCIDYGDECVVLKSNIFLLHRQFAMVQSQAFVCRLSGIEELYEASKSSQYLTTLLNRTVHIQMDPNASSDEKSSPVDPALAVIMYDAENETVINEEIVSIISIEAATPLLNKSSPTEVFVTQVLEDGTLYIQVHSSSLDDLNQMLLQLECDLNSDKLESPKEPITKNNSSGRLYFAQYSEDGHWYRAKFIDWAPTKTHAQILFVDYGNTTVIKIGKDVLYPLDELSDVLNQYPYQALRVRMQLKEIPENFVSRAAALMPPEESVLVKLQDENEEPPLVEFFKRSEKDNVLFSVNRSLAVENEFGKSLEDGNNNANCRLPSSKLQRLISLDKNVPSTGFLSCPDLPEKGNYFEVQISSAVHPYNFFVQPYSSKDDLSKLMTALQEKYENAKHKPLRLEDIQPGKIYASKHKDGIWYRTSVIKVIHEGSITAFLCDFGQYLNLNVNELVPLEPEFMRLPYQAIKAKLVGIRPIHSNWSMDDCESFKTLVSRKAFVSILVDKETDDLYQQDTVLCLRLIDTSSSVDVHIGKELVKRGIAKLKDFP